MTVSRGKCGNPCKIRWARAVGRASACLGEKSHIRSPDSSGRQASAPLPRCRHTSRHLAPGRSPPWLTKITTTCSEGAVLMPVSFFRWLDGVRGRRGGGVAARQTRNRRRPPTSGIQWHLRRGDGRPDLLDPFSLSGDRYTGPRIGSSGIRVRKPPEVRSLFAS